MQHIIQQLPGASELRRNWGWFLILGIVLIVLGTIALGSALLMTIASVFFFGWILIIGGVLEAFHFLARKKVGWFPARLTHWHPVRRRGLDDGDQSARVSSLADFDYRHVFGFRRGVSDRSGTNSALSALGLGSVQRDYFSYTGHSHLAAVAIFRSMGNRLVRGHRNAAQRLVTGHA
jgi:hypothetical protein